VGALAPKISYFLGFLSVSTNSITSNLAPSMPSISSNLTNASPRENVASLPGAPLAPPPPAAPPPPIAWYIFRKKRRYTANIDSRATFARLFDPLVDAARKGTPRSLSISIRSCDAGGFMAYMLFWLNDIGRTDTSFSRTSFLSRSAPACFSASVVTLNPTRSLDMTTFSSLRAGFFPGVCPRPLTWTRSRKVEYPTSTGRLADVAPPLDVDGGRLCRHVKLTNLCR